MRIAQVPPLYEAVPPRFYGGTERVVAHLTDALVDLGHDVTLFASGDARTKAEHDCPARNVFLFVGAEPETDWLEGCNVMVDAHGFVCTGQSGMEGAPGRRAAALESSVPGVFAVGDVRSGSVKRVGGAIGEGAAAVAQIHQYLSGTQTVA